MYQIIIFDFLQHCTLFFDIFIFTWCISSKNLNKLDSLAQNFSKLLVQSYLFDRVWSVLGRSISREFLSNFREIHSEETYSPASIVIDGT